MNINKTIQSHHQPVVRANHRLISLLKSARNSSTAAEGTRSGLNAGLSYIAQRLAIVLWLLISGCGRTSPQLPADPPAATAPSLAVVAEPIAPTEVAEGENGQPNTGSAPATSAEQDNEAPTSAGEVPNSDVEPSIEILSSNTDIPCQEEVALDLAGYPGYATLVNQLGCPHSPASVDPVAINEFGPGPEFDRFMLWFSSNQQIYVLRPDHTWQAYPDTWTEDEAEILCNPVGGEEASPPLPRRGFGKLWCSDSDLQETMGLVTREERLCQHTVTQVFETGQMLGCFEDATVRYIQIFDNQTWEMVFVQ